MMMDEFEAKIQRTWTHFLIEGNLRDIAAIAIDSEITCRIDEDFNIYYASIDLPPSGYNITLMSEPLAETMKQSLIQILQGRASQSITVEIRAKLLDIEDNWKEVARSLIAEAKNPNQGSITEKVFARESKEPYLYNEMKFGSRSEIRIAQELEKKKVLFFPLPLAVRNDTGRMYLDHREVDFLVCQEGVWGILEVAYHEKRYEKDVEKSAWFKKSGILCVEYVTAERCYETPAIVVQEFLDVLKQYKR